MQIAAGQILAPGGDQPAVAVERVGADAASRSIMFRRIAAAIARCGSRASHARQSGVSIAGSALL